MPALPRAERPDAPELVRANCVDRAGLWLPPNDRRAGESVRRGVNIGELPRGPIICDCDTSMSFRKRRHKMRSSRVWTLGVRKMIVKTSIGYLIDMEKNFFLTKWVHFTALSIHVSLFPFPLVEETLKSFVPPRYYFSLLLQLLTNTLHLSICL